jgi:hypothetical protein
MRLCAGNHVCQSVCLHQLRVTVQACPALICVQIPALAPFVSVILYRSIADVSACLSVRLSHVLTALPGWPRADDGQD